MKFLHICWNSMPGFDKESSDSIRKRKWLKIERLELIFLEIIYDGSYWRGSVKMHQMTIVKFLPESFSFGKILLSGIIFRLQIISLVGNIFLRFYNISFRPTSLVGTIFIRLYIISLGETIPPRLYIISFVKTIFLRHKS